MVAVKLKFDRGKVNLKLYEQQIFHFLLFFSYLEAKNSLRSLLTFGSTDVSDILVEVRVLQIRSEEFLP